MQERVNSLPHNPDFLAKLWKRTLLKTVLEKKKILETSIFSFILQ